MNLFSLFAACFQSFSLVHHNSAQNDKKKNERQKNQEPSNTLMSVLANQVQDPCPEKDIDDLDGKNHEAARNGAREHS